MGDLSVVTLPKKPPNPYPPTSPPHLFSPIKIKHHALGIPFFLRMISPVSPFLIPILELIISVCDSSTVKKKKGIRAGLPLPLSPPYPAGAAAISPINDKEGEKTATWPALTRSANSAKQKKKKNCPSGFVRVGDR